MQSTIGALKSYKEIPKNGIAVFCGLVAMTNGGKNHQVNIQHDDIHSGKVKLKKLLVTLDPLKPIPHGMYKCDNRFHVEELLKQLKESNKTYGYIIMSGSGCLFANVNGSRKEILREMKDPNLPKKHNKGGQSSVRFSRLRKEARYVYLKKVAERAKKIFIENDLPNVNGIIIGGCAGFKNELASSDLFDQRLKKIIIDVVDVAYSGKQGLEQAVELTSSVIENLRYSKEKNLVNEFMNEIAKDTGKYVFGYSQTMYAVECGAVEKLLIWEDLPIERIVIKENEEERVVYLHPNSKEEFFKNHSDAEIVDSQLLVEYLIENYKNYGTNLELISNHSSEGAQFSNGFGGIGGLLRYQLDLSVIELAEEVDDIEDSDDDEWI